MINYSTALVINIGMLMVKTWLASCLVSSSLFFLLSHVILNPL